MSGKLCTGKKTNSKPKLSSSRSFCEGMAYRQSGTLLQRPLAANPHEDGNEDSVAWETGWNIADNAAGGLISKGSYGCCGALGVVSA